MSCRTTATIHHAEGVRFRDMQALDEDLMEGGMMSLQEVYEERAAELPGWNGPFVIDANGELLIADAEEEPRVRYGSTTQVWACWSDKVSATISRHLVAGELVIELLEEGQRPRYVFMTPGAFENRDRF